MAINDKSSRPAAGFLSPDLGPTFTLLRKRFSPWFDLADSWNEVSMRVLPTLEPSQRSNSLLVAAAGFGRALTSYQSAYILAERGLLADARTVTRAAAETALFLAALSKDERVADILIDRHYFHHRKLRAAWLNDPQAVASMTPEQVAAVKRSIDAIDAERPNLKSDPLVISNLAAKGSFVAIYNAVYRVASGDAAHISIDALNRHIKSDAEANIVGLKFGPELEDLPDTISIAISTLSVALYSVLELFEIRQFDAELNQCMDGWKRLGIPSEFNSAREAP